MEYSEAQIRREVLLELSQSKTGTLTITELIDLLEQRLKPGGKDVQILANRSDTHFSQKVRNTVSHRNQGTGLAARGLAVYAADSESWTVTGLGRSELASLFD